MNWRMSPLSGHVAVASVLAVSATTCALDTSQGVDEAVQATAELGSFNVLTRNYDNQRTAADLSESILKTSNVNASGFGKLFQLAVDDQVYSQILYASAVPMQGVTRNVIFAATLNNSVYAFDADNAGGPLWQRNFNGAGRPTKNTEVGQNCGTYRDFSGNIGIVGTPVIDAASMTMFFVARTVQSSSTVHTLRAVDIRTGNDRPTNASVVVQASVPGTGAGSSGGQVAFNPQTANQRMS